MRQSILTILLLAAISGMYSCGSNGDFTSPFIKTYEMVYGKDTAVLFLQRTIAEATEYDSNVYSTYKGTISLPEMNNRLTNFYGETAKGGSEVRLLFNPGKGGDTMGFLQLSISGDGTSLKGWKGLQVGYQADKGLPDSVQIKATVKTTEGAKINFGLKPKTITKEYPNYHYGANADYDMEADTIPRIDTVMELDIVRGSMDSAAFQRMSDGIDKSKESGDLSLYFASENLLSLKRYLWEEGGAHPLDYTYYYSYDLNTGKRLKLLDVFQPYTLSYVADAINDNLKKQLGLTPNQSLRDDAFYNSNYIGVSKNFFVTDKGIGFQYNIYEIASYASGETMVFVPFEDVRDYLNPDFEHLIRKPVDHEEKTAENTSSPKGSAKFVGKWIPVGFNQSFSKSEYLVIKKDAEKFRLYRNTNGRLVENTDFFLRYDEKEDCLYLSEQGVKLRIVYDNQTKNITVKMPATRFDKASNAEFKKAE